MTQDSQAHDSEAHDADAHDSEAHSSEAHDADAHDSDAYLVGIERPVFEGDWAKAGGRQRQAHMQAVAAWKKANGQAPTSKAAAAQSRMAEPSGELVPHAADVASLQAVIDDRRALNSDRIRAIEAKQKILNRQEEEKRQREHGPLIDLKSALDTLDPSERVTALGRLLRVSDAPASDEQVSDEAALAVS